MIRTRRRADVLAVTYFTTIAVGLAVALGQLAAYLGLPAGLAAFLALFVGWIGFDALLGAVSRFVDRRTA